MSFCLESYWVRVLSFIILLLRNSKSLRAEFYGLKISGLMYLVGEVVESPMMRDFDA